MKTDYILRRRALLGISALFCSTLLLFGCQDTAIPVGPELVSPVVAEEVGVSASAKPDKCDTWPNCDDGGGSDPPPGTLSLVGGMRQFGTVPPWPFDVHVKETKKTLKASNSTNDNFTKPTIQMYFNTGDCAALEDSIPDEDFLKGQLIAEVADAKVVMSIDKDNLPGTTDRHFLLVQYEHENRGKVTYMLGNWPGPVTVTEGEKDVFTFTGPVVVGNDGEYISCTGQTVVATLVRNL